MRLFYNKLALQGGLASGAAALKIELAQYRSVYAIGDIHGCSRALGGLLDYIKPDASDLVITLGDYIDRGDDSRGVIDHLLDLPNSTNWIGIRGNHEQMLLNVLDGAMKAQPWLDYGGASTLASYGVSNPKDIPDAHLEFLNQLIDSVETEDFFLTHACYDPALSFSEQPPELLRWRHLYDGVPQAHQSGKTVIVGHTPSRDGEVLDLGHLVCLDTFCHGGGWLSIMELKSRAVWQFSKWGQKRNTNGFLVR